MDIIHFYKELDISVVTIHLNLGQHMTLPNKKVYIYEESPNAFYTNLVESVRVLSNFASQYGIKVCVENTNQASFVEGAIRRLEASNAAFTWDVGHDYKNFQMMFEYYINKYNLNIGHMHLHNVQDGYDHLPLQTGEVNVKNYLGYAKERGIDVVIEVKDRESLIESCEFIFEEETE
jgi:sugar phosphate isomerase/epimerase